MRKRKKSLLVCLQWLLPVLAALLVSACDEGKIYEEEFNTTREGAVVKAEGDFSGMGQWGDGYTLVLAGYGDSNYAEISKEITGGTIVLSGIPASVTTVEVGVINRLRQRVATFSSLPINALATDTIRWSVGTCNSSVHAAVQKRIFNTTCANCHGGSNHAAAGLDLTEGKSYGALVDRASTKCPGATLVAPGDTASSLLYTILTTGASASWAYDHSVEVLDPALRELLKRWIADGAKP